MPNRENVIKGLEHCTNGGNGCFECPYSEDGFSATTHCKLQIDRDALELLKEQPEIVRCKECVNRHNPINCRMYSEGMDTPDGWFCADGEARADG